MLKPFLLSGRRALFCLAGIVVVGCVLRAALSPLSGHDGDRVTIRRWTESAARLGMMRSYEDQVDPEATLPMYGPAAMAVLTLNGKAYIAFAGDRAFTSPVENIVLKIPAILADVAIIVLLWFLFVRQSLAIAVLGSMTYALHPAAIYLSGGWVQLDAVAVALALGAYAAAQRSAWGVAGACVALACSVKLQSVLLMPPLLLLALVAGRRELMRSFGAFLGACCILALPFALLGMHASLLRTLNASVVLADSRMSWNAFNAWYLIFGSGSWDVSASNIAFGIITYGHIGWLAFLGILFLVLLALRQNANATNACMSAGVISLAAFLVLPEMHERYLFPAVAFLIPLALRSRYAFGAYVAMSVVFLLNLLAVVPLPGLPPMMSTDGNLPRISAAVLVVAGIVIAFAYRRIVDKNIARHGFHKSY